MQLPPIDRIPNPRPAGADGGALSANRVIPVPPVNPSNNGVQPESAPKPGVVNLVNQVAKPNTGEAVYTSTPDPAKRGTEAATAQKDWTIHRPEPEKVEVPPPEPISKLLMDLLMVLLKLLLISARITKACNGRATAAIMVKCKNGGARR